MEKLVIDDEDDDEGKGGGGGLRFDTGEEGKGRTAADGLRSEATLWASMCLCGMLVLLLSVMDVTIVYSRDNGRGGVGYGVWGYLALLEAIKLGASLILYAVERVVHRARSTLDPPPLVLSWRRASLFSVPALIYAAQRSVEVYMLSRANPEFMGSAAQLHVIITAGLSWLILSKRVRRHGWFALAFVTFGACTSVLSCGFGGGGTVLGLGASDAWELGQGVALGTGVFSALMSSSASVFLEWRYKEGPDDSINAQNSWFYLFGLLINLVVFLGVELPTMGPGGFFHGYDATLAGILILAACGGLLTCYILKTVHNVAKVLSQTLAMSFALGFAQAFLDYRRGVDLPYVMGTLTVVMGVALYNMDNVRHMWRAWRTRRSARHFEETLPSGNAAAKRPEGTFPSGNAFAGVTTDDLVRRGEGVAPAATPGGGEGGRFPITDEYYNSHRRKSPFPDDKDDGKGLEEDEPTQYTSQSRTKRGGKVSFE